MTRVLSAAVLLAVLWPPRALAEEPAGSRAGASRAALVRFHTACSNCHAGECSGRLSFLSGKAGAQRHIHNYAPSADPAVVRELYGLLITLKRTCQVELPVPATAPAAWTPQQLREWFNPDLGAWFIPLGELGPGPVVVELAPGAGSRGGRVQLLDDQLETLAEAPLAGQPVELRAAIARKGACFLLVRSAKALEALRVGPPAS